jgi:hypothetical protein
VYVVCVCVCVWCVCDVCVGTSGTPRKHAYGHNFKIFAEIYDLSYD